jgi:hypothetical protein
MFAKLMICAAAMLAAALFAYLGHIVIDAYGAARYHAGLADGRLEQMPGILSANAAAAKAELAARERIIAAETAHAGETTRLAALIQRSQDEVKAYETSAAGAAGCLDADRVRAIEAVRTALFPSLTAAAAGSGKSGPVPPDSIPAQNGRQPG